MGTCKGNKVVAGERSTSRPTWAYVNLLLVLGGLNQNKFAEKVSSSQSRNHRMMVGQDVAAGLDGYLEKVPR
jgi:hypothetical protein